MEDTDNLNSPQTLRARLDTLLASGNAEETIQMATTAVQNAKDRLLTEPESSDGFTDTLTLRARLYRSLNRLSEASQDYKEVVKKLEEKQENLPEIARINMILGAVYDALDRPKLAAEAWQKTLQIHQSSTPPKLLDAALISNNLAYLMTAEGDLDQAESYFLHALEIFYEELGPEHEQTATVANSIGTFYHHAGYFEQARDMHMIALKCRKKNFGDLHPDTAQSYNNLALAMVETNDRI